MVNTLKILMIGTYDLSGYSRGRILYKGLQKNRVYVELCLSKNIFSIIIKILKNNFDIILVTGKPLLFISKFLKFIHRKPIVFDAFISDYDNLINDRKIIPENTLRAKLIWLIDRYACLWADSVILDTQEHIKYFVNEFHVDRKKFKEIVIGADEDIFQPKRKSDSSNKFIVSFHGTFIPLQGIEYIIKAASLLEKERSIIFEIIGSGQTYEKMILLSNKLKLKNISFLGMHNIENVPILISHADICLGIFGNTKKTSRVIPNKAYEILALNKPLITGNTPAIRSKFEHKNNCYLCRVADEKEIATAIRVLKNDTTLRNKISDNGYKLFINNFTSKKIGKRLKNYLLQILNSH